MTPWSPFPPFAAVCLVGGSLYQQAPLRSAAGKGGDGGKGEDESTPDDARVTDKLLDEEEGRGAEMKPLRSV